jgi:hypothetical protein
MEWGWRWLAASRAGAGVRPLARPGDAGERHGIARPGGRQDRRARWAADGSRQKPASPSEDTGRPYDDRRRTGGGLASPVVPLRLIAPHHRRAVPSSTEHYRLIAKTSGTPDRARGDDGVAGCFPVVSTRSGRSGHDLLADRRRALLGGTDATRWPSFCLPRMKQVCPPRPQSTLSKADSITIQSKGAASPRRESRIYYDDNRKSRKNSAFATRSSRRQERSVLTEKICMRTPFEQWATTVYMCQIDQSDAKPLS